MLLDVHLFKVMLAQLEPNGRSPTAGRFQGEAALGTSRSKTKTSCDGCCPFSATRWRGRCTAATAPGGYAGAHGASVTCSGATGTPSLQRPMKRCWAVPPSATRQSCRAVAQACSASSSFQGP
jgi:hypothetical protein